MVRWRGGGGGYISFLDHHSKGKVIDTGSWVFSREKVDAGMGRRAGARSLVVYQKRISILLRQSYVRVPRDDRREDKRLAGQLIGRYTICLLANDRTCITAAFVEKTSQKKRKREGVVERGKKRGQKESEEMCC